MFDVQLPDPDQLADIDARGLAEALAGWARVEAAAAARRLAVIAEITARRIGESETFSRWACDGWDAAAAEVSAAAGTTHGRASGQMYLATALRNRLPRVAALFAEGMLDASVVSAIAWHTTLITDPRTLSMVDTSLCTDAVNYGSLSTAKMIAAIQAIIAAHDPDAVRRTRNAAQGRNLVVDTHNSESGISPIWGRLYAHDAVVLDRRLAAMADAVCDDDPRSLAQRRADALGVLAAGGEQLRCACGKADCAGGRGGRPAGAVVVHVLADAGPLAAETDPQHDGDFPAYGSGRSTELRRSDRIDSAEPASDPQPDPDRGSAPVGTPRRRPAQIVGGPLLPATVLAELIRSGAIVRPLVMPTGDGGPERRYRPSAKLADAIACRDLTCRFPNCDRPADVCDVDHAIAYADGGSTHPSNLRLLCRKHHLLKTFWNWRDRQHRDGTIDWISPSGQTYTTHPGARFQFPQLCRDTGDPPAPVTDRTDRGGSAGRALMMPTRKRTRAQNRAHSITTERNRNRSDREQREREAERDIRAPIEPRAAPPKPPRHHDPPPY